MPKIDMTRGSTLRKLTIVGVASITALSLAACAQSQRDPGNQGGKTGGTMTFGAEGKPKLFDPFYATDGATFRISRQVFEGLVGFKLGSAEAGPELATKWESSPDGKSWTFTLKQGVKFHDGTDFNAEAACFNFNRWYNQKGAGQSSSVSEYWVDNFGGFADGAKPSLFKSCTVKDAQNIVVELTGASSKFPDVLGLPSFSMQSPTAMKKYNADNVVAQGESFVFPEYALKQPTGTGPFKFVNYDTTNNLIELGRFDGYHGDKAKLDKLNFKVIADETARKQALQSGDIDGYDYPAPADWAKLKSDGFQVVPRDAFNVMYLGITQKNNAKLQDFRVRKAISMAINREQLVKSQLPETATVATQFMPKIVQGYNPNVKPIEYSPDKAKALLAEAGASNLEVNFWWPSEVTRPYMPNPQDIFGAIAADLRNVGIKLNVVTKPWNGGYLTEVDQAKADLFLLGWTGDQSAAANWIGTFFGNAENRFYTKSSPWGEDLAKRLDAADVTPDKAEREKLYQELNRQIVEEYLPAVPLSHSPPAFVLKKDIKNLTPSPLTAEEFSPTTKG
ncbi:MULTISPECIES: ABC transporter substrate-binding protein [unclassified Crossiella]|uniref:ABC transporter substrate-binding protein n=1 Tax=unclassified Crossiella TaxID=2620835 RepID=UPI001FFF30C3|nr:MULTISPECIES: ABC transporter substrate-binding protein [unclassified Crossiella]MCK2237603.1 ABC transporter substrate-binding protein [Crossiella sp. S99.2]MCK2254889.1 ABC transporter substrate-binding protein [Crossiella sp. S99.1]